MLALSNTPNLAGVTISGDSSDLQSLYGALHEVVGDEGEFLAYDSARMRVLGVCYDIRHAFQGDREMGLVESGMDRERMRWLGRILPEKNLYYHVPIYYPEMLFVTMALDDFARLYAKKRAKSAPFPLLDKRVRWDPNLAQVRLLQSQVVACLKDAVSEASFKRILNLLHHDYPWTHGYMDQYLDLLNTRYLHLESREERQKALLTTVKRMVEQGPEYQALVEDIRQYAMEAGADVGDVRLGDDYPEEVDW